MSAAKEFTPVLDMTVWLISEDDQQLPRMRGPLTVGPHETRGMVARDENGDFVCNLFKGIRLVYTAEDECIEVLKAMLQAYIEWHTAQADECRLRLRRRSIVEEVQREADRVNPR